MKMKDVINAVDNFKEDAFYKKIAKQREDLNRTEALTQILITLQNIEYDVVKAENIGSKLKFCIAINSSLPQGIDFEYQIDGREENYTTIAELNGDYNVINFLDSIEDHELGYNRQAEITINYGFKVHILSKIIGKKLFENYCETREKMDLPI